MGETLSPARALAVRDPARRRELTVRGDPPLFDAEPLTERAAQVPKLITKGRTKRDIGGPLGISAHTVRFHVAQVVDKLGASSRAEAESSALRLGLIGLCCHVRGTPGRAVSRRERRGRCRP